MLFVGLIGTAVAVHQSFWMGDLLFGFDVRSKAERHSIARGLAHDIRLLKAFLPSLTVDQERWLEKEEAALDSLKGAAYFSKYQSLTASTEYQVERFHGGLEQILDALDCALNNNQIEQELYCWTVASWALTDSGTYNDAINLLDERGVVNFSPRIREQFHLGDRGYDAPWFTYQLYGREIQERIVLPMMQMLYL